MIWTKAYCKIIANHSHHLNCQACCEQFLYHPSDVILSSSLNLSRLDTNLLIEGSLEVKLPTIWTNEKQRWEESEKRREEKKKESLRRKKIQVREKVGKPRNTAFFQWFAAPEGRKVGSLKRRVRIPLARWEMKNCTPLWREAHLQVKKLEAPHVRSTFWSCDVKKMHAVVARSTVRSQNVQKTPGSDHFWKMRCRKSARRCGAKHISKSQC